MFTFQNHQCPFPKSSVEYIFSKTNCVTNYPFQTPREGTFCLVLPTCASYFQLLRDNHKVLCTHILAASDILAPFFRLFIAETSCIQILRIWNISCTCKWGKCARSRSNLLCKCPVPELGIQPQGGWVFPTPVLCSHSIIAHLYILHFYDDCPVSTKPCIWIWLQHHGTACGPEN